MHKEEILDKEEMKEQASVGRKFAAIEVIFELLIETESNIFTWQVNAVCSCKHSNNAGFPAVTGKPVNYSG